jgi:hypothetical protein
VYKPPLQKANPLQTYTGAGKILAKCPVKILDCSIDALKPEAFVSIKKLQSLSKENTMRVHYKDKLVNIVREIIAGY